MGPASWWVGNVPLIQQNLWIATAHLFVQEIDWSDPRHISSSIYTIIIPRLNGQTIAFSCRFIDITTQLILFFKPKRHTQFNWLETIVLEISKTKHNNEWTKSEKNCLWQKRFKKQRYDGRTFMLYEIWKRHEQRHRKSMPINHQLQIAILRGLIAYTSVHSILLHLTQNTLTNSTEIASTWIQLINTKITNIQLTFQ